MGNFFFYISKDINTDKRIVKRIKILTARAK